AARDAYEQVLKVNANFALALNNLAVIYSEQLGQPDKAFDLAKKAREASPNEPHTADTFGWISFKRGDYAGALRVLQESATKLPDSAEISYHLGMASYMVGDEASARVALEKAVAASADFSGKEEARKRLALLAIDSANPAARAEIESNLRER